MATWKFTPDTGEVVGTHTDMPLVIIPSKTELGSITLAQAQSVRMYSDALLTTELEREIVSADEIHFLAASVSSSSEFWLDYDGVRSDYATTATFGAENVWSDYLVVYHMEETSGMRLDSTGGYDLTQFGGVSSVTGKAGNCASFDAASSEYLHNGALNPTSQLSSDFTLSTYFKTNTQNARRTIASFSTGSNFENFFILSARRDSDSNTILAAWDSGGVFTPVSVGSGGTYQDDNWHYVTVRRSGNTGTIRINDSVEDSDTNATSIGGSFGSEFNIGYLDGSIDVDFMDGEIDELRIRTEALSSDWETTEYNNQNDNAAFWVATEVGGGGGGGATFTPRVMTY